MISATLLFAIANVLKDGVAHAPHAWLAGLAVLIFIAVFIAWTVWAWSPSRRELLDAAARLPLDDDGGEL